MSMENLIKELQYVAMEVYTLMLASRRLESSVETKDKALEAVSEETFYQQALVVLSEGPKGSEYKACCFVDISDPDGDVIDSSLAEASLADTFVNAVTDQIHKQKEMLTVYEEKVKELERSNLEKIGRATTQPVLMPESMTINGVEYKRVN